MYQIPTIIQRTQLATQAVNPVQSFRALSKKILKISRSVKTMKNNNMESVRQGIQRGYIHTSGPYPIGGKAAFGAAYEHWSDDMACVLQGSCLPGSTRYCRTNSMFSKLELADIDQGGVAQSPGFSGNIGSFRSLHTSSKPLPVYSLKTSVHDFHTSANSQVPTSFKSELWSKERACILQRSCLPGSTLYCHTNLMFGYWKMTDILHNVPRCYCTSDTPADQLSQRERLKRAVRDYGSTVIVFHVCISLISLGGFYLAVSSGIDMQVILSKIGFSQEILASKLATGTSTFVLAYAVHKLFAPVRIGITLTCTPFIVRYLRGVGVLKIKKPLPK